MDVLVCNLGTFNSFQFTKGANKKARVWCCRAFLPNFANYFSPNCLTTLAKPWPKF